MALTDAEARILIDLIDKSGMSIAEALRDPRLYGKISEKAAHHVLEDWATRRGHMGAYRALQRLAKRAGSRAVGSVLVRAGVRRGGAALVKLVVGATGIISLLFAAWTLYEIYQAVRPSGPSVSQPCPTPVYERRKCPWTPEGYSVEPCGPGFCWDGGPQGSLACKQEESVPNSGRTYTTDLVCNEGYVAERDPCTNVILRCVKK